LSPEQAKAQPVDERTDVYGAGIVLYALLAGRGPFHHVANSVALLQAHAFEVPKPPSALARQPLAPEMDRAVLRALAKRKEDRYANAKEFSEALVAALRAQASAWAQTEVLDSPLASRDSAPAHPQAKPAQPQAASPQRAPAFTGRGTIRMADAPMKPLAHATTEPGAHAVARPAPNAAIERAQIAPEDREPTTRPAERLAPRQDDRRAGPPSLKAIAVVVLGGALMLTVLIEVARMMVGK
jgi:serine/threonine protein kinase